MDAKIFRVNYKSDFILTLTSDAGWMTPFCIKFWTGSPMLAYYASYDGETYNHCTYDPSDPTKLTVQFDDHHLPIGNLKYQVAYHFTVADFPENTEDEVTNQANVTTVIDGDTYQVMLDLNGETAPEIQFALPAYANELQRIQNEQTRIAQEQQRIAQEQTRINQEAARVTEFNGIKAEALADHQRANEDHSRATSDHQNALADRSQAAGDHSRARSDHSTADSDHLQASSDHSRAQSDHKTALSDHQTALSDHTQANTDHTRAESDHTRATADSSTAAADHRTASTDHTQANTDHARAESDHQRVETDLAEVEEFSNSLGAYDISAANATGSTLATYPDIATALGPNGSNIPEALRKGGMSVKFVLTYDNKYVQYFLVKNEWSVSVADWQKLNIAEQFESERENYKLAGAGSTFTYTSIQLIKGRKYRIVFDNPSWERNNTGTDLTQYIFAIASKASGVSTYIFYVKRGYDTGTLEKSYEFDVPANSEILEFGGRANVGTDIVFSLEDITEVSQLGQSVWNNSFVGKGTDFSLTRINGLVPGRKYRVIFKNTIWDYPEVAGAFKFAISNWYNGASSDLYTRRMTEVIPPFVDITIPNNSDYIGIGGRATTGTIVEFNIIDLTGIEDYSPSMLSFACIFTSGKINANNTTKKIEITQTIQLYDKIGAHQIQAQEIPYNWGTSGRTWFALVASSDYSSVEMVEHVAVNYKSRLIGFIYRWSSSDNNVRGFYGATGSVLFTIDGFTLESVFNKLSKPFVAVCVTPGNARFNANNTTKKIQIPACSIMDNSGYHAIPAQEINYAWVSGYNVYCLVIDSSYQTFMMKRLEEVSQDDRIIANISRTSTSSTDISSFYGCSDWLFLIDGKTQYEQLPQSEYILNGYFVGKGSTFSLVYLRGLVPGRTYRLILKNTIWSHPIVSGSAVMAVANWYNGSSTDLVRVGMNNNVKPYYDITIPENSDYISVGGRADNGVTVEFNIIDVSDLLALEHQLEEIKSLPINQEIPKTKVTTVCGSQGLTIVGNTIIHFNHSADDHSTYGNIYRWDKSNFSLLSNMTHNLGHAATVDYNEESDALVVGNGTWDNTIKPRLDIVNGASAKISAGGALDYSNTDIIHIELATNIKEIGGRGLICTFGGNWRVVFLSTGQNAPQKIFKCLLGVGDEDFSDHSSGQDDVTKWGTFISGKSDTEYNGTLKVLSTYTGPVITTNQGLCYRCGFLYFACGMTEAYIHKIQLFNDGKYKIMQTCMPVNFDADGAITSIEPEGLCFYDKNTMLVGLPAYGGLHKIDSF